VRTCPLPWEVYHFRWDEAREKLPADVYNALLVEYCEREALLEDGDVVLMSDSCPERELRGLRGVVVVVSRPCVTERDAHELYDEVFKEIIFENSRRILNVPTPIVFTAEHTGEVLSDEEICGILDSWDQ
jgi:hypothetical protein